MSKSDRESLIENVILASKQVATAAQSHVVTSWLGLDVTMAQLKAMFTLEKREPMTVSHLADALGVGRSAASLLVDHLVQDELVERTEDAEDRRRSVIQLSPRGKDVVFHLWQVREVQRNWLEQLNQHDLEALEQGLNALAAIAQRDVQPENCN